HPSLSVRSRYVSAHSTRTPPAIPSLLRLRGSPARRRCVSSSSDLRRLDLSGSWCPPWFKLSVAQRVFLTLSGAHRWRVRLTKPGRNDKDPQNSAKEPRWHPLTPSVSRSWRTKAFRFWILRDHSKRFAWRQHIRTMLGRR